jgi:acetyl esterase/lipase
MSLRDRIDPQSREPLELLLAQTPGGLNSIPDIVERRAAVSARQEAMSRDLPPNENVIWEDRVVPGLDGDPGVSVRIYRPVDSQVNLPGLLYIHGGGMVMGSVKGEHARAEMLCDSVRCVVVSVEYRLAPEHPHPAPMRDCFAGLTWMAANSSALGIDPQRIALYGASAGGGLVLATALMARDQGGPQVCFQMPIYPMIDDRHETPSSHEITDVGVWDRPGNIEAWEFYLGGVPADAYAAPARAEDLSGLPPTFIDVGELDLFRDEDVAFANRLLHAGIPTEFHLYPGAYHGSENFAPAAELSQRIWATRIGALRRALV